MSRAANFAWVLVAAALASAPARAACPCYTLSSASNTYKCGVEAVPGTNPSVTEWQALFATVSGGPATWGTGGPAVAAIGQGCGKPEPTHSVPATFPCELIKAIAMQESGWRQFCAPTTPPDQVGKSSRTIISFDCGYGVGQVTSGMHIGETPGFDRARVAAEPLYNMATGASILAGKWRATNCVGDNQPKIIEDWYTAVWAYNGLTYSNNPTNPNLDPNRGVYNPSVGGAYTYQERVFGWVEHPPSSSYWTPVALAYPNRASVGTTGSPPDLPEPDCASPTNCTQKRSVHVTACGAAPATDGGVPADMSAPKDLAARDLAPAAQDGAVIGDAAGPAGDLGGPTSVAGGRSCDVAAAGRARAVTMLPLCLVALALLLRRRQRA